MFLLGYRDDVSWWKRRCKYFQHVCDNAHCTNSVIMKIMGVKCPELHGKILSWRYGVEPLVSHPGSISHIGGNIIYTDKGEDICVGKTKWLYNSKISTKQLSCLKMSKCQTLIALVQAATPVQSELNKAKPYPNLIYLRGISAMFHLSRFVPAIDAIGFPSKIFTKVFNLCLIYFYDFLKIPILCTKYIKQRSYTFTWKLYFPTVLLHEPLSHAIFSFS